MDVPRFLDLAVELEAQISELYEQIAELSGDPAVAARLKAIASEELNHANVIRAGNRYYDELPNIFTEVTMDETETWAGIEEIKVFRETLSQGQAPIVHRLKKLLEFERRFERIHLASSVKITEPSLKQLFAALTRGDQSHILVLTALIESYGGVV